MPCYLEIQLIIHAFIIFLFQLELETTMRQECEAKLTLTSTNYETKIASLEKELDEVCEQVSWH